MNNEEVQEIFESKEEDVDETGKLNISVNFDWSSECNDNSFERDKRFTPYWKVFQVKEGNWWYRERSYFR